MFQTIKLLMTVTSIVGLHQLVSSQETYYVNFNEQDWYIQELNDSIVSRLQPEKFSGRNDYYMLRDSVQLKYSINEYVRKDIKPIFNFTNKIYETIKVNPNYYKSIVSYKDGWLIGLAYEHGPGLLYFSKNSVVDTLIMNDYVFNIYIENDTLLELYHGGIFETYYSTFQINDHEIKLLDSINITGIGVDSKKVEDTVYILSQEAFYIIDTHTHKKVLSIENEWFEKFILNNFEVRDGQLYIGCYGGILRVDISTKRIFWLVKKKK